MIKRKNIIYAKYFKHIMLLTNLKFKSIICIFIKRKIVSIFPKNYKKYYLKASQLITNYCYFEYKKCLV